MLVKFMVELEVELSEEDLDFFRSSVTDSFVYVLEHDEAVITMTAMDGPDAGSPIDFAKDEDYEGESNDD